MADSVPALFDDGPLSCSDTDPNDPSLTVEGEVTIQDMVGLNSGPQVDQMGAMGLSATPAQLVEVRAGESPVLGCVVPDGNMSRVTDSLFRRRVPSIFMSLRDQAPSRTRSTLYTFSTGREMEDFESGWVGV